MIKMATDGACKGNPGVGGFGVAVDINGDTSVVARGGSSITTNNIMELTAFIHACYYVRDNSIDPSEIEIYIDSTYVLKGVTEWLRNWIRKDFKKVKNSELWREVASLEDIWRDMTFTWVKGHSGHYLNELADEAANQGCERYR